jgi:hypothetical protein
VGAVSARRTHELGTGNPSGRVGCYLSGAGSGASRIALTCVLWGFQTNPPSSPHRHARTQGGRSTVRCRPMAMRDLFHLMILTSFVTPVCPSPDAIARRVRYGPVRQRQNVSERRQSCHLVCIRLDCNQILRTTVSHMQSRLAVGRLWRGPYGSRYAVPVAVYAMPIHNQRRLKAVKRRLTFQAKPLAGRYVRGPRGGGGPVPPVARSIPSYVFYIRQCSSPGKSPGTYSHPPARPQIGP